MVQVLSKNALSWELIKKMSMLNIVKQGKMDIRNLGKHWDIQSMDGPEEDIKEQALISKLSLAGIKLASKRK